MIPDDPTQFLRRLFDAGLAAADPAKAVPTHLPEIPSTGRTVVVGAGKAAASMARALENAWPAGRPAPEGLVVTRYDHAVPLQHIECVEAAHPVPDAAGRKAAQRILELATGLGEHDLLICLISGGGSALLALPAEGLTLEDKQAVSKALLKSGADIAEMNCVRKHLSALKGGRLAAAAAPARVVSLLISDVPGDDPATIASGPTVADPTTFADARAILTKYGIDPPAAVRRHLEAAAEETPKPGDPRLSRVENRLIARPQASLEAMAETARAAGVTPVILGDAIEGEAREVAQVMAGIAQQVARHGQPAAAPAVLLSGGETTVTVRGQGRGGRQRRRGHLGARRRQRRDRRQRGQRGRAARTRQPEAGAVCRARSPGPARGQRRLRLFPGAGRSGDHRPDADQRQRPARDPDHRGLKPRDRRLSQPVAAAKSATGTRQSPSTIHKIATVSCPVCPGPQARSP